MTLFEIVVGLEVINDIDVVERRVASRCLQDHARVREIVTEVLADNFTFVGQPRIVGDVLLGTVRYTPETATDATMSSIETLEMLFDAEYGCNAWAEGDIRIAHDDDDGDKVHELWPALIDYRRID